MNSLKELLLGNAKELLLGTVIVGGLAAFALSRPFDNKELHFDGTIDGEKVVYSEEGHFPFTGVEDHLHVRRADGTIVNFYNYSGRLLTVDFWKGKQRYDCWNSTLV